MKKKTKQKTNKCKTNGLHLFRLNTAACPSKVNLSKCTMVAKALCRSVQKQYKSPLHANPGHYVF